MGRPSKLDEAAWGRVFGLEALGVPRAEVAERFGVSARVIGWQARKRGIVSVDGRRRAAQDRLPGKVLAQSRSGMTPERWVELLERRNLGVRDEVLMQRYGVSRDAISRAARRLGMRKCDVPGAVMQRRGPGWSGVPSELRPEMAFAIDAHDVWVHRRGIMRAIQRAANEERVADIRILLRFWNDLEWFYPGAPPFRPGGGVLKAGDDERSL
ncbi:MAG: hypothetical protein Q8S03_10965 [Brevundimonas sp.]|uniref:hypothetical protein n=1 Tax=Brevundimonas sp. TaxID=1871086 RepID=UPI002732A579|nr:hypothetical protein [Brevundimonas sp.]MDP3405203.1 hypothetical protein [Brevundimonas sp.]